MYALIQTGATASRGQPSKAQGSLWRSDDGGKTWSNVSWDRRLIGRAGYYIRIRVSPDDPDHVLDRQQHAVAVARRRQDLEQRRRRLRRLPRHLVGHQPGDGRPLHRHRRRRHGHLRLAAEPDRQHERVAADRADVSRHRRSAQPVLDLRQPAGRRQHADSERSADRAGERAVVRARADAAHRPVRVAGGGRGGRGGGRGGGRRRSGRRRACRRASPATPIPSRTTRGSSGARATRRTSRPSTKSAGLRRSVSPWMHTLDSDPVGLKYRCQWSPPLAIDWFDNSVYFGCQVIFRTRDRGQSWEVISADLSTGDPSRIKFSGGVVGDNLGQFYGAVISAIAPSRTQQGVLWVGTNDGKVWISRDAGKKWVDLTKNVNMPPWGIVRRIDASHFEPGTAYMAVDYHLVDNRDPFFFKTSDFGQTWTRIDGGLPKGHPLDYALSIAENPNRKGMIFAGTGHAFFYSLDDGKTWKQFKDRCRRRRSTGLKSRRTPPKSPSRPTAAGCGSCATSGSSSRATRRTAGRPAAVQAAPGDAPRRRRHRQLRLWPEIDAVGAGVADHARDPRRRRRGDQQDRRAGARRPQPGVVEPAVTPRRRSRCCGRFRPTTRTSGRRAGGRDGSGRSRTGASARSSGSRGPRPASTPCG